MNTALQKAIAGEKVPDSKKTSVLNEALDKVKSLGGRISKAKEMSEELADAAITTAEVQGTVFAASFAEGYLGEEKMDLGPLDMRVGGGLVFAAFGLYKTMAGKGGSHALALGNGLLAVGIGRMGRNAGKALAEKKSGPPAPQTPAAAPAPAPAAAPVPVAPTQLKGDDIGEIARMVRMVPGTEGDDVAGRRRMRPHRRPRREEDEEEVSGRRRAFIRERD